VSQEHIAHEPFSLTNRAYSRTSRPFTWYGQLAVSDPSGSLVREAALNNGCGDGGVTAAHPGDVDITFQRRSVAAEAGDGDAGDNELSEHAIAATSANTHSRMRTITSVHAGVRVYPGTIQMLCQRRQDDCGAIRSGLRVMRNG
jgi:hypothetical protein